MFRGFKKKVAALAAAAVMCASAFVGATALTEVKAAEDGQKFAFKFGLTAATEGFTQVTNELYDETTTYGFMSMDGLAVTDDSVTCTADIRFKVNVGNGNYTVKVDTTAETITSEVVETVKANAGIAKTGKEFDVAVCDEVLDLTFPAGSAVKSIEIIKHAEKTAHKYPMLFAIGDSTTKNTADGARSWGNCVADGLVNIPQNFSGFENHGMGGRDSVNYYNQARVEAVLLKLCPGDYVTINMGINSRESGEQPSYKTMIAEYYVEAVLQRGGIPVIVTATPQGPVGKKVSNYNTETGVFKVSRGGDARNSKLREIATEKNLVILELGQWAEDWMNSLTMDDVTAYNATYGTAYASIIEMVQSWYVDHNHYKEYLGIQVGNYIFGELEKLAPAFVPEPETTTEAPTTEVASPDATTAEVSKETESTEAPTTVAPTTTASATTPASTQDVAADADGGNILPFVIAGVAVLAVAAIVIVVVIRKKK